MKKNIPHEDNTNNPNTAPKPNVSSPNRSLDTPDPFDPASIRLSQDYSKDLQVEKVITKIPVRKPHNQEFIRVRPGDDWKVPTWLFYDKNNRDEIFLVAKSMVAELRDHARPACLVVAITRQGNMFLWPLKLPGADGRDNPWNATARDCAKLAESDWISVKSNTIAGYYEADRSRAEFGEPEWPADYTMADLLRLGFQDKHIDRPDHPIAKRLRGEE